MAEHNNKRCSPVADSGVYGSGKKTRAQAVVPNGEVKQEPRQDGDEEEREEGEVSHGGGGQGSGALAVVVAAGEATAAPVSSQIDVRMDVALFHCQGCLLPLKPPVFKCESGGHVVCSSCHGGHGEVCSRADTHCGEMDAVIGAAKVPCAYRGFGCEGYVVYHDAADHHRACPYAPCSCPEPGCAFLGSPPALLDHFAADHSRPIIAVRYGRPWNLSLPLSQRWHVVVGQEDRSVFLVSLGALGAATAVSLVCVRACGGAAAAPQFWCKLSVELQGDDKDRVVLMASAVSSSALCDGAPAPGQGMFLAVPQELVSGEALAISVRIDRLRSPPAAAAAAANSTTPRARTTRRLH